MIYEMGLESQLVGVTFECHSDKPKVVRSYLEGTNHTSKEIKIVSSKHKEKVYTI
jgi:iron complex transport system substrate-binding protein